jgi:hypothetical protein
MLPTARMRFQKRFTSSPFPPSKTTPTAIASSKNYKITSDPNAGDAVLRGKVVTLEAVPLLFDTKTGAATTMLLTVRCEVTLTDRETQKVLFHTDKFVFRNEYEISTDVKSFFEEQDPAIDRIAKDFAQRLVASVTENF